VGQKKSETDSVSDMEWMGDYFQSRKYRYIQREEVDRREKRN